MLNRMISPIKWVTSVLQSNNANTEQKIKRVIDEMLKLHNTFTLPFGDTKERDIAFAWLTNGSGVIFEKDVMAFNHELGKLFAETNSSQEYTQAFLGVWREKFTLGIFKNDAYYQLGFIDRDSHLLYEFFIKYPRIADFLHTKLFEDEARILQKVNDAYTQCIARRMAVRFDFELLQEERAAIIPTNKLA